MTEYSDNFELFWKAYPARNGRKVGKKPAFAQWNKLTADQRKVAFATAEKNNRMQTWGKYVRDAQRWLRDAGWEDEIEAKQTDMLGTRPMPEAHVPEVTLPWQERMINRLFKTYVFTAMGLPEVKQALAVKHEILKTDAPALEGEPHAEAAETLAGLFLTRMDLAYGLNLRDRIMRIARKPA